LRQCLMDDPRSGAGHGDYPLRQVTNRELVRIPAVDRSGNVIRGPHQADHPIYQIVDKAERTRLLSISVDGYGLIVKSLDDEIGHDTAVVRLHARSVSIEDAQYLDFQIVLASVVEKQGFRAAFAFIIAGAGTDRVHMTPIRFLLRVNLRVAVDFGCRRLKNSNS